MFDSAIAYALFGGLAFIALFAQARAMKRNKRLALEAKASRESLEQLKSELEREKTKNEERVQLELRKAAERCSLAIGKADGSADAELAYERLSEAVEISQYTAAKGKEVIVDLLEAIDEIFISNQMMVKAMEESNAKVSEVVQVIADIDKKTKVINEIAFQTKLLAFNASVEAARAGEHGKGFAVVAEEIGTLAQVSGSSAFEISQMLDENIEKVNLIVEETNTSLKKLVAVGSEKVETGRITATESDIVLDEVVKNIDRAGVWIQDIIREQADQRRKLAELKQTAQQFSRPSLAETI